MDGGQLPMSGKTACFTKDLGVLTIASILLAYYAMRLLGRAMGDRGARYTSFYYVMIFMSLACVVGASEDEQVRRTFRLRIEAENQQPNTAHGLGWHWVSLHFGLTTPAENSPYQAAIHRPDSSPMPSPTFTELQVIYQRQATSYLTAIEHVWGDLGRMRGRGRTWSIREMPRVLPPSSLFQANKRHFMLSTLEEHAARPNEVPIYFEVEWYNSDRRHRGYTKPWIRQRITVVAFLQQHGFLASCTTTHRCGIHLDGQTQRTAVLNFRKASYIHLRGIPMMPPSDSEDDIHDPHPMMYGRREPSTSTSYSSEEETVSEGESILNIMDGPEAHECSTVAAIYRPTMGTGRPPFMHTLHRLGTAGWYADIYAAWPPLRYAPWTHYAVHSSFVRDFPQGDDIRHYVLTHYADLSSPLHQVTLLAGAIYDMVYYQAWSFQPFLDQTIVINALGLTSICAQRHGNCKVYINGLSLGTEGSRAIHHGDYILLRLHPDLRPQGRRQLAGAFEVDDEFTGNAYTNAMGIARISGDASGAMTATSPVFHAPQGRRRRLLHEDYWITAGIFCMIATTILLKIQLKPIHRHLPCERRMGKRRLCARKRQASRKPPYLLLWLVVSQPVITTSLQIQNVEFKTHIDNHSSQGERYIEELPVLWRRIGHHVQLPPPGNTPTRREFYLPVRDEPDIQNTNMGFLQQCRTQRCDEMFNHIDILYTSQTLRTQLADFETFWSCKVDTATEFAGHSVARTVRSTFPETDKKFGSEGPGPKVVRASQERRLERRKCVDPSPAQSGEMEIKTIGAIAHSLGIDNLGAPRKTNYPQFQFVVGPDVGNDDDGIFASWQTTAPPDLCSIPDLPTTSLTSMQSKSTRRPAYEDKDFKHWHIYTDGSASRPPQEPMSTWAVIIYTSQEEKPLPDNVCFYDWYGGITEIDPLDKHWIGATQHDSKSAEASAITWALLFYLQTCDDRPLHLYCDPLTVLEAAKGNWRFQEDDTIMLRTRATYLLIWTYLKDKLTIQHVRGHSGHFGNETADRVAGVLREGHLAERVPHINLAKWYHGSRPAILWAWSQLDADVRAGQVMTCDKGTLFWQHTDEPSDKLRWDSWNMHDAAEQKAFQLHLNVATYNVGSIRDVNRSLYLREQADQAQIHVLGIQETRSNIQMPGDSNFIRLVSVAEDGQGGCELWLNNIRPFAHHGDIPLKFERNLIHVVCAEKEILIAKYNLPGLKISFIVAHAPHSGHNAQHITQWWRGLTEKIAQWCLHTHAVVMIDANSDVHGDPPYSGSLQHSNRDLSRTGDHALAKMLQRHMLWAPSTFEDLHRGQTTTWTANDMTKNARNDFILLPLEWKEFEVGSYPILQLDSGVGGLDHTAVGVHIHGWFHTAPTDRRQIHWDRESLSRASEETWEKFFSEWPAIPWHLDTTSHAAILEQHLHQRLRQFFPKKTQQRRPTTQLSTSTWDLFTERNRYKRILNAHHKAWTNLQLQESLDGLKDQSTLRPITVRRLVYALKIAATWKRHHKTTADIKRALRNDRAGFVSRQMEDIVNQDSKQVLRLLKPMRLGRRTQQLGRKPLPMIRLEDGSYAPNLESAQDRWRRHFSSMEGGTVSSTHLLLHEQIQLPQGGHAEVDQLPSIFELERHMQKAKAKKAMGPDGIPPEILKYAAAKMAYHYWPLFAKTSLSRHESLQFKGGRLVAAYKQRGSMAECSSYRALLVSSSLAKSFHSVYRARSMEYVQKGAGDLQFTSHRSPSVGLAAHIIRLHQQDALRKGHSTITLFLDIKEAFYCVIRQHSLPATFQDEDVFRFLERMGVRDMHIGQVASLLAEGPTLEALGCDEHLLNLVTEFHRATWFHLGSDIHGPMVRTEKGTRPGDGFADVLWALTFAKWLVRLENKLSDEGVLTHLPWDEEPSLLAMPGAKQVRKGIVAWADDVAVMADSPAPLQAIEKLTYITESLVRDLLEFGMTPNFKAGKTEAVVDLKGKTSHIVRRKIFNEDKGLLTIQTDLDEQPALRIVHKYRHLGGYITHGGKIAPELHHRLAQGRQICSDYRTKVFANKAVPLSHRLQVLRSTALTAALYNTACWPRLNQRDSKVWVHGIMALYRIALQKTLHHMDIRHMTDTAVLGLCHAVHPLTELRLQRLRHYAQYVRRNYPLLWALLASEQQWKQQVEEDFKWLYDNIQGLTIHPHPNHDLPHWNAMILQRYGKWKGILKRVTQHAALQLRIHADVQTFHRRAFQFLDDVGVAPKLEEETQQDFHYKCFICDRVFTTHTGWAVHAFKSHGRTHPGRQLQTGRTCSACGKTFNTQARLARHFRTVPRCANTVAAQGWEVPLQPGFGSNAVARDEDDTIMQTWTQSDQATVEPGHAWATTPHARALHTLCETADWSTEEDAYQDIMDFLQQEPVSHSELGEIRERLQAQEFENGHIAMEALHSIESLAKTPVQETQHVAAGIDSKTFMATSLHLPQQVHRTPTAYRYVLHVFSGARRDGDLHSALLQVVPPDGTTLFPISIDIVLSDTHCDLLDTKQQAQWLAWARQGAIHMAVGGPPCETWSVSRLRWYEEQEGPRPLRDGARVQDHIWGLPQLRLKEARQVRVANALLHFCILLFLAQVLTAGIAIIEHPDQPGPRGMLVPPSIWILPIMRFIQSASTVYPIHIKQGYWNAISPKPTLLLTTIPTTSGAAILKCLEGFQVRDTLPPPLPMGRSSKTTYNTAALKRYPRALCRAIAEIAGEFADRVSYSYAHEDAVKHVAVILKGIYMTTDDQMDDGQDFAGDRN